MIEESEYERLLRALGQAFAAARSERGLTQAQLGDMLEKGQSAIGKLERGPAPNVALRVVFETAVAMDVRLSEIFAAAEELAGIGGGEKNGRKAVNSRKGLSAEQEERIRKLVEAQLQKAYGEIVRHLATFDS